ncbi:MAG TPA: AAA family ATPase, partial [Chloroflexota bacterium]|nr:AAA family ATPase [Chloroflexota bacterium]
RAKRAVYIAQEEADVWVLHQNGFAALSLFGVSDDPARLGHFLQNNAIAEVHLVYHNDALGRRAALRVYDACKAQGIVVCWRLLNPRNHYPGARVSDLFAAVGFDRDRFGEALRNLAYAPNPLINQWRSDPLFEPAPEPGTEDEFFPCLDDAQLEVLPLPTCLIDGVLLAGKATMMTGVHNLGKSAIALDMSLCISQGLPWYGLKTLQGPVTYIAAEGGEGIQTRLRAYKQEKGLDRVPGFRAIPQPVQLHEAEQRERLVRTLQRFAAEQALLVVDTLSQCSLGLSEMSSEDMALFLSCLGQMSRTTGAATLILHHNNRGNTYRGSSALPANCDGHLELLGESAQASVKLHVSKIKDFPDGANWPLQRQQVTIDSLVDAQGKPVTSVLFVPAQAKGKASEVSEGTAQPEAKGAAKSGKSASGRKAAAAASTGATPVSTPTASGPVLTPKESVTLQALRALCAEGQKGGNKTSGTGGVGKGGVGATASEWKLAADRQGVPSATFDRAKKKLVDRGLVGCDRPGQAGARYFPL